MRHVYWKLVLMVVLIGMEVLPLLAQAQPISIPAIILFKTDVDSVPYVDVEAGTAAANFSWDVVGMTPDFYLRMEAWVNEAWGLVGDHFEAKKTDRIVISHPQDFGLPTYRLSVVNQQGVIVAASFVQMHYGAPDADTHPQVTVFSSILTALNTAQLADGKVFAPVHWMIDNRWPQANPVFEQVMPDGSVVSVELPRRNLWLPRLGDGVVTPRDTAGQPVILQIRLLDVETGQTLDTRQITLEVSDSAPLTPSTTGSVSDNHAYPGVSTPVVLPPAPTATPGDAAYDPNTPGFSFQSDRTEIVDDNRNVTLSWNAPNASQVWIEMHHTGTSGCNKIFHAPDQVFGPLSPSGSLPVTLPDSYLYGGWFEIYVDHYIPVTCQFHGQSSGRVDVDIPALKPGEYFTANAPKDADTRFYTVTPGDTVELSWSVTDGRTIYMTTDDAQGQFSDQGPLPSTGTMTVCPRAGYSEYVLYLGGAPQQEPRVWLDIHVSDSQDFPANRGEGTPCWTTP